MISCVLWCVDTVYSVVVVDIQVSRRHSCLRQDIDEYNHPRLMQRLHKTATMTELWSSSR